MHSVGGKITRMLVKDGEAAFVQGGCCNAVLQESYRAAPCNKEEWRIKQPRSPGAGAGGRGPRMEND